MLLLWDHSTSLLTMMTSPDSTPLLVKEPSALDVLCGQDTNYGLHTGNKILRKQIDLVLPSYRQSSDRREKTARIDEIITFMRIHYKSRFLKPCPPNDKGEYAWEEVSEQSVRDKVSHALRFAARRLEGGPSNSKKKQRKSKSKIAKTSAANKHQASKRGISGGNATPPTRAAPEASSTTYGRKPDTDDETEELDEAAKIRLAGLHKRQLEILEDLLKEQDADEEDASTISSLFSSSTTSSTSRTPTATGVAPSCTNRIGTVQEEDEFWRMMADVEPIPIAPESSHTFDDTEDRLSKNATIPTEIFRGTSADSLFSRQPLAHHHHAQHGVSAAQQHVPLLTQQHYRRSLSFEAQQQQHVQLLPPLYNPNTYGYHSFDMSPHYLFPPPPQATPPPNASINPVAAARPAPAAARPAPTRATAGPQNTSPAQTPAPGSASLGSFVQNLKFAR